MPQKQIVFPGDEVAIAEEFLPGPGTYEEDGNVYAATLGTLELDTDEFTAKVHAFPDEPAVLKVGDVIIGTIQALRSSMAIVEARALASNPDRQLGCDTNGTLPISKIAEYYIENIEDAFRLGDIIRAEVTGAEPSLQLSTKGPTLGTVKSFCPRCRTPMTGKDQALVCPECEWKETGKLAADYGQGHLIWEGPEPEFVERPRRPGGGRGGPRGGGRGGPRGGGRGGPRDGGRGGGRRREGGGGRGGGGRSREGGGGRGGGGRGGGARGGGRGGGRGRSRSGGEKGSSKSSG